MTDQNSEQEVKKRAIFDAMSKRGQERILRMGYEEWDPFQEPKDPRERIRSSVALRADMLLRQFYEEGPSREGSKAFHKDLLTLCRGLLQGEMHAQTMYDFCNWYRQHQQKD